MTQTVESKHLRGKTEITLLAPIKRGMVPIADEMLYAQRLQVLFGTLFGLRQASVERNFEVPMGFLERLRVLQTFTWALVDNGQKLLLTVAFDGPFEPYIRAIVNGVGPLLDAIFCHCEGYEGQTCLDGYPQFERWVRTHQVNANFFYSGNPDLTPADIELLKIDTDVDTVGDVPADMRDVAQRFLKAAKRRLPDAVEEFPTLTDLAGINALYRIWPYFKTLPAGQDRDRLFFEQTVKLVFPFKPEIVDKVLEALPHLANAEVVQWFKACAFRPEPKPEKQPQDFDRADVQGNILTKYEKMTVGAAVLLQFDFDEPGAPAEFLARLAAEVTTDDRAARADMTCNIAFAWEGLQRIGLSAHRLEQFPAEFREGMAARAGMLGDVASNAPDKWQLPQSEAGTEVRLSTVDAVLLLEHRVDADSTSNPLEETLKELRQSRGVRVLHVQRLKRPSGEHRRSHFGFVDGISQPNHETPDPLDSVPLGELLLGYPNQHGEKPTCLGEPGSPDAAKDLFKNGSFLVLRKLWQDVEAFEKFAEDNAKRLGFDKRDPDKDIAKALVVGRHPDGTPLVGPRNAGANPSRNDFDYEKDPDGEKCPLHAHIRRANPRDPKGGIPRIIRRGFSYDDGQKGRGTLFMAYNASIASQFEVIKGWMSGGNSTGVLSTCNDLLTGLIEPLPPPQPGGPQRKGRFRHALIVNGEAKRFEAPERQLVTLQWGMYLFVPSRTGLSLLAQAAAANDGKKMEAPQESPHEPHDISIGDAHEAARILSNESTYSARGYWCRMNETLKQGLHLGMDRCPVKMEYGRTACDDAYEASVKDGTYDAAGKAVNGVINRITRRAAYEAAFRVAESTLTNPRVAVNFDGKCVVVHLGEFATQTMGVLSNGWFGLPAADAGPDPDYRQIISDFFDVAKNIFWPNPHEAGWIAAKEAGPRILKLYERFDEKHRFVKEVGQTGALVKASSIGATMGFVGPTASNFLRAMNHWIRTDELWRLQQWVAHKEGALEAGRLLEAMEAAMRRDPGAPFLHRVAVRPDQCKAMDPNGEPTKVNVGPGDRVAIHQVPIAHETGNLHVIFGGDYGPGSSYVHACPGKEMALGVMLGMIHAVFERKNLRARALLTLEMERTDLVPLPDPTIFYSTT